MSSSGMAQATFNNFGYSVHKRDIKEVTLHHGEVELGEVA